MRNDPSSFLFFVFTHAQQVPNSFLFNDVGVRTQKEWNLVHFLFHILGSPVLCLAENVGASRKEKMTVLPAKRFLFLLFSGICALIRL